MRLPQPRREATICLVLCLAASSFLVARQTELAGDAPAPGGCGTWLPPVEGEITRAFQAPAFAYGPGHRGVDFEAALGTPVRAAADGVVAFAGSVAASLHVVVAHDGGRTGGALTALRTTYAFLAGLPGREGDRPPRGPGRGPPR